MLGRDINLSFAPLMLPLIPKHPIIPGESRLFCELPEGLGCSLGRQLLDTSVFGLVTASGLGGHARGYHLCVSTKWSVLLPLLFWWFSVGRCLHCRGGPCWRDEAAVMTTHRGRRSSLKPPLLLILCLHAMFCFCPSVPALLLSHTRTHTLPTNFSHHVASLPPCTPADTYTQAVPSASSSWSLPSDTLLSNVAWWCHRQDQDALCSICRRGSPFILYYVVMIGPDRGPPNCWVRGTEGPGPGRGQGEGDWEGDGLVRSPRLQTGTTAHQRSLSLSL